MSEEKKGAARLDPTSTDAMHWAECFCEQVEINSEDEVHIEPEFLMAYFANFWAAVNDPLQNTIESQAAEISALRERVRALESWKKERHDLLHRIFQKVEQQANDEGLWADPVYASEAYIQSELRRLHEVIEGKTSEECAEAILSTRREEG